MPLPIAFVIFRILVHATEDFEKVVSATQIALTEDVLKEADVLTQRHLGYYGNPITVLDIRLQNKTLIRKALRGIVSRLSQSEKQSLLSNLDRHLDHKGSLYFRLDKQAAFDRSLVLGAEDTIRVQVRFALFRGSRESLAKACEMLFFENEW
ncbi:MAG: RNA-binding domain-containing protein [Candidatus Bathyarchaeia archaeon]